MTFCLGMKVKGGLIGIADTRVTSGSEVITAKKMVVHQKRGQQAMFLMTSGLRSVRDKTLTYFEEALERQEQYGQQLQHGHQGRHGQADHAGHLGQPEQEFDKLYKAVNLLAVQLRRVAQEDKTALQEAGLKFNLNALIGGQFAGDKEHKLYLLYPEGNWVEVSRRDSQAEIQTPETVETTPYHIIGTGGYGKPLLDRVLRYESGLDFALKVGFLAFDATRKSAADVAFPLDVAYYRHGSFQIAEHRFEKREFSAAAAWWQRRLEHAVEELPSEWMQGLLSKAPPENGTDAVMEMMQRKL